MKIQTPLDWPNDWIKTEIYDFYTGWSSYDIAIQRLQEELIKLNATDIILTHNDKKHKDKGACVYFYINGQFLYVPCDRWHKLEDNILAISFVLKQINKFDKLCNKQIKQKILEQLIKKQSEILLDKRHWHVVLGVDEDANIEDIKKQYKKLVKIYHPDNGGTAESFIELQEAYNIAIEK